MAIVGVIDMLEEDRLYAIEKTEAKAPKEHQVAGVVDATQEVPTPSGRRIEDAVRCAPDSATYRKIFARISELAKEKRAQRIGEMKAAVDARSKHIEKRQGEYDKLTAKLHKIEDAHEQSMKAANALLSHLRDSQQLQQAHLDYLRKHTKMRTNFRITRTE